MAKQNSQLSVALEASRAYQSELNDITQHELRNLPSGCYTINGVAVSYSKDAPDRFWVLGEDNLPTKKYYKPVKKNIRLRYKGRLKIVWKSGYPTK